MKDISRETVEKLVKRLRAKEKALAEVSQERDTLAKQLSEGQDQAANASDIQAKLQVLPLLLPCQDISSQVCF